MGVQRQSKQEYMARMQGRYLKATRREKGRLLDEIVEVTGYHRRHVVQVLRHGRFPDPKLAAVQGQPADRVVGRGSIPRSSRGHSGPPWSRVAGGVASARSSTRNVPFILEVGGLPLALPYEYHKRSSGLMAANGQK